MARFASLSAQTQRSAAVFGIRLSSCSNSCLLINEQFGITNNVHEQDMSDLELKSCCVLGHRIRIALLTEERATLNAGLIRLIRQEIRSARLASEAARGAIG